MKLLLFALQPGLIREDRVRVWVVKHDAVSKYYGAVVGPAGPHHRLCLGPPGSSTLTCCTDREILRHVTEQGSGEERDIPVMTVPELVRYWGYPVEEHWVTTEDGYILGKLTNILVRSMQN